MLAYCDYIADAVQKGLIRDQHMNPDRIKLNDVSKVQMDLHPDKGYFVSTKKTISVEDMNGKKYKITVEEV